uniref:ARAD1D06952p n=1 Tax=Blastobotrys adeninivorans TaxID=409370 RepID=A0A060T8I1_BLAAD
MARFEPLPTDQDEEAKRSNTEVAGQEVSVYPDDSAINRKLLRVLLIVGAVAVVLVFGSAFYVHERRHKDGHDNQKEAHSGQNMLGAAFDLSQLGSVDRSKTTVYGAPLRDWQLDTSREYHLSRYGLWDSNQEPTTREYNFVLSEIVAWPNGVAKNMSVINGKFPGPVIEANVGDRVVVHLFNNGSLPTTMHFHGLAQNGTNFMDGVPGVTQCSIPPGSSYTYNFTLTEWGTYWYHSHYDTQYLEGFAGPVVIHSPEEDRLLDYDEDVVVFLSDYYHDSSFDLLKSYIAPDVENAEPIPDSGLIQGLNKFDCSKVNESGYQCYEDSYFPAFPVIPDKTYRLRVVSAGGFSEFDFSIDNHTLTVIEADGVNVEPLDVTVLRMSNAQRYSVLVKTESGHEDEGFWMRANMNTYCYDGSNPNLDPRGVRAIFSYPGYTLSLQQNGGVPTEDPSTPQQHGIDGSVQCTQLNSSLLVPSIPMAAPDPDQFVHIDASFQIGARQISLAYFNNTSYKPNEVPNLRTILDTNTSALLSDDPTRPSWANEQMVITVPQQQVIDLLINNYDDGGHPFHMHGHKFWILASGKGYFDPAMYNDIDTTNPARRDTVHVDSFGWTLVRFVTDNPGVWIFHCHIVWHVAAGMVMQFSVQPEHLKTQAPPQQWYDLCSV